MNTETLPVMVIDTGSQNRAAVIRRYCKQGAPVELRGGRNNPADREAISVWLRCPKVLSFFKTWSKIGYVQVNRGSPLEDRLNRGSVKVKSARVLSHFAPLDREEAPVALYVDVEV